MPFIEHDNIRFHYACTGLIGPLVAFQHGLGGEISQPQSILGSSTCLRTLSFDFRGHGQTMPLGPPERLTFSVFADDFKAILDVLRIDRLVIGGISMGAGVALNFALRYPDRVRALILSRPAWLDAPCPPNLEIFRILSSLIKEHGPQHARKLVLIHPEFQRIERISRDNAASIVRQLEGPDIHSTIATLASLPLDAPCAPGAWRKITAPTLVLVNQRDAVHPVEYGQLLASGIPGARLVEIIPKEIDPVLHAREARENIEVFAMEHSQNQI